MKIQLFISIALANFYVVCVYKNINSKRLRYFLSQEKVISDLGDFDEESTMYLVDTVYSRVKELEKMDYVKYIYDY